MDLPIYQVPVPAQVCLESMKHKMILLQHKHYKQSFIHAFAGTTAGDFGWLLENGLGATKLDNRDAYKTRRESKSQMRPGWWMR